jgi:hypothetical protein
MNSEDTDIVQAEYYKVLECVENENRLLGELLKVKFYCDERTLDRLIENTRKTLEGRMARLQELQAFFQKDEQKNTGKISEV